MVRKYFAFWLVCCCCCFVLNADAAKINAEVSTHRNECKLSERSANEELCQIIKDYYKISAEDMKRTRYMYNYVDLNDDGVDEIFVVVNGPSTSGSGGSSALLLEQNKNSWQIKKNFTLVRTPVTISDVKHNGYHDIVFSYYGGGSESGYSVVFYDGDNYVSVSEGIFLKERYLISGYDILCDKYKYYMDAGLSLK